MRGCRFIILLALAAAWALPQSVHAGVYNSAEPDEGPLDPVFLSKFQVTLYGLRAVTAPKVEVERPLRKRYLLHEDLFSKVDVNKLSAEEKLNFSAALIRRNRPADAIGLLLPATRRHPEMFLLQSNLATAYHLSGDKRQALITMEACLDAWPKESKDLTPAQQAFIGGLGWLPRPNEEASAKSPYARLREAEAYFAKLLKLRSGEPKIIDPASEKVDNLFDVKFVADSGEFEPGKIAKAEKAKLPRNALEVVQQLLVWLPHDTRLYWLLGEVYNAQGDIKAARKIFDELVFDLQVRAKPARDRRQVLNNYVEPQPAATQDPDDPLATPRPPTPPPGLDWRNLTVAFVAGMLVAIFAHWQIREIRRRQKV